jgi:acyl-CoA thioester hydrolase
MRPPFKFSATTRVGFSDTDAQGIVYYGRYMPYFDMARVEYHRQLRLLRVEGPGTFVIRAMQIEYHAPARFDDLIEVDVRVARLGRSCITYEFAAYLEGEALAATASQTLVHLDLAERRQQPIPDSFRRPIQAFEGDALES